MKGYRGKNSGDARLLKPLRGPRLLGIILSLLTLTHVLALFPFSLSFSWGAPPPLDRLFPVSLFRAYQKKNCAGVAHESQQVSPTHPWRDWALLLKAECLLQKKFLTPAEHQAALTALAELELHHVNSPLRSEVTELISRADFQAAAHQKNSIELRRLYIERAIERWAREKKLGLITPAHLHTVVEVCTHDQSPRRPISSPSTNCDSLLRPLLAAAPKGGPEESILLKGFRLKSREDLLLPANETFDRLTRSYRDADPDQRQLETALEQFKKGAIEESHAQLEKLLQEFPKSTSRVRALYWLAQIEESQQNIDSARQRRVEILKRSPYTWYGLHAALQLDRTPGEVISSLVPQTTEQDPQLSRSEERTLRRTETLLRKGFTQQAAKEVKLLRTRDPLSSKTLVYWSELAHQAEAHAVAFPLLTELIQRNSPAALSTTVLRRIFPSPSQELWRGIETHSQANQLDPLWVLSLIKQESAFDESALSSVGATGLMQLMPATALEVIPGVTRAEIRTLDRNILAGTRYFSLMLKRYQGSVPHALAAYNAGPAAVDRWLREGRDTGTLEGWIENIPYRETRDYVGSIFRNRWWYHHLLEGKNLSLADLQRFYRASSTSLAASRSTSSQ
jgi:soluble lytic murein transglycosylase-like protein